MSRKTLVLITTRIVFAVEPLRDLSGDAHDRIFRKGIESLRNSLTPIVSSSGEARYRLDTSPDVIENMVLEWKSRIAHLQQKAQIVRQHYGLL